MPKLINWTLAANPFNWVIMFLMVAVFAAAWGILDPLKTNASQGSPP